MTLPGQVPDDNIYKVADKRNTQVEDGIDLSIRSLDQDIFSSKENLKFKSYVCLAQELQILGGAVKVKSPEYFSFKARYADVTEERRIKAVFHKDQKVKSIF